MATEEGAGAGPGDGGRGQVGSLVEALADAERAVHSLTHLSGLHARVVQLFAADGRRAEAADRLRAALALDAGCADDYEALAFAAFGLGEHHAARALYARVVELMPNDAMAWYNLATAERSTGDLKAADAAGSRAIALDPQMFQVHLFRSQLFRQTTGANHVAELKEALRANRGETRAQIFLNYALGKELDDLGRYDEAFAHFARGARARRSTMRYDVNQDLAKLTRIREVFDHHTLQSPGSAAHSSGYVFILGLPRSGTTLIERVLTGHPGVRSNGETDNFSAALLRGLPPGPGDVFERATRADHARVASLYARSAGACQDGELVIEKLPLNYLYAGAIRMALPEAKIVLVRRQPLDNCFAMFSALLGAAYPFSYDLEELAVYYAAYETLIAHWKACLSDQLLELRYEDFIDDPAAAGAGLARHVGLEWREESLKIENNTAPSGSGSGAKARRPIYKTAVARWRNYSAHLGPLLDGLERQGVHLAG